MDISPATLGALFYNFNFRFQQVFNNLTRQTELVASEIASGRRSQWYPLLDKVPRLRKWVGAREVQNVALRGYNLVNQDYELTVEVDRNDIEDDELGAFGPLIDHIAQQSALWPDDLVIAAMLAGTTAICHDGQAFFSTSHPINIDQPTQFGTQSNNYVNTPLTSANYAAIRANMLQFRGRDGRSLRITPTHVVIGSDLEQTARQILHTDFTAPAAAVGQNAAGVQQRNVLEGSAQPHLIHDLTDYQTGVWYLVDATKPLKPFIFQRRKSPQFVSFVNPTDPRVYAEKKFEYGVDSRGAAGYGLYWTAVRCSAGAT
jgi:phage major head subunit gpT-like protein